ncbi:hypothetical protein Desca_2034 [Desulfotomaculum nigrificans CO-1-SRB]|uniref:DUF2953 domain-containing protein n=1 Tax=Desulfotomaculum nigrificans (strain DSM 14880 / VKM B-2319 / CO-1-SRB) TaxID=868595 RepID=F6B9A1_DESCC|nr:DUF2953 domain-containing protein [Desulfotomaculum nigrificans]AEF94873.1 hypothetical protein Desca_2034 [Desulfotomaculum nigrificans CO-1-SRB]
MYVLLGVGLLLTLVLLSYLRVHLKYFRWQEDDILSMDFFLFGGFIKYRIEVPVIVLQQKLSGFTLATRTELETGGDDSLELIGCNKEFTIKNIQEALSTFKQWWPFMKALPEDILKFLKHLRVKSFNWRTDIGTPDAAATGMLAGLAWAVKGSLTSIFYQKIAPGGERPVLTVEPNFRKQGFTTTLDCIFEIRVGNIMVTGIKILQKLVTRRGVNKIGRASHRRPDENCHGEYQGNG